MAKIIRHENGEFSHYESGIIYDLGYIENGIRTPFYVGETSNPEKRLKDHQRAGKNADDESTRVYQTIHALNEAGIEWSMETLAKFGKEGPTDLEDEWIMRHLFDEHKLTNMKKGNARWLEERQEVAGDMRKRGISSYRKYRAVLTQEELDRKHAKWIQEQKEIDQRAATRKRIAEESARVQAEINRQYEIKKQKDEERRAKELAAWEADRPAREARIKAETERLQAEDAKRQQIEEEKRKQRQRQINEMHSEFVARANKNYAEWPEDIRQYHQRTEDAEVKVMLSQGMSEIEIEQYLERDKKMQWPPSRSRV